MAHGIFPTHNNYYKAKEIFPFLSKKEKKEVFFPDKKSKKNTEFVSKQARDEKEEN